MPDSEGRRAFGFPRDNDPLTLCDVHDVFWGIELRRYGPRFWRLRAAVFAAVPDFAAAAKIYRVAGVLKLAHRFSRKLIPRECLHVSLLLVGRGSEQLVRSACEAVACVNLIPFDVSFDRTASFRGRPGNRPLFWSAMTRAWWRDRGKRRRWTVSEFVLIHSLKGHKHVAPWRFDV
jgi:2'-5' RNA ligase